MTEWIGSLLVAAVLLPFGGGAHRRTEEGNRHYLNEAYDEALRSYTEAQLRAPQAGELYYDIGNVLYRQGDFAGAAEAYTRALLQAPPALVAPAAYNLGNARFKLEQYDEAIQAYERALRAAPPDQDAERNLELALRAQQQRPQQPDPQGDQGDERQAEPQPQPRPEDGQEQPPPDQGQGGQRTDPAEPREGEMTAADAQRLLDGLEEQEQENPEKQEW